MKVTITLNIPDMTEEQMREVIVADDARRSGSVEEAIRPENVRPRDVFHLWVAGDLVAEVDERWE